MLIPSRAALCYQFCSYLCIKSDAECELVGMPTPSWAQTAAPSGGLSISWGLFTRERRLEKEIGRHIGGVLAVKWMLCRSVVVKKELRVKAKVQLCSQALGSK